jgi:DNA repair exonuclease SbcCD ATPase subunit
MNTKLFSKLMSAMLAIAIVAAGVFVMPTSSAYADDSNPPSTPTVPEKPGKPDKDKAKENQGKAFEKLYERLLKNLSELKSHLDKANDVVKKTEDVIAEAKSKGKDTTAAEAALATFKTELAKAQASYNEAKKILDAHAGFDAGGKVTDRDAAKDTVLNAAKALREGQKTLAKAVRDAQKAVKNLRKDRKDDKDKATPAPTATPKP